MTAPLSPIHRCHSCGRRFPDRVLGMESAETWRAEMLGIDAETHSYIAGADLDEEVDYLQETLRLAAAPIRSAEYRSGREERR